MPCREATTSSFEVASLATLPCEFGWNSVAAK